MYELTFTYDTEDEVGKIYYEGRFKGTWEEMTKFVASHGLVTYLEATLISGTDEYPPCSRMNCSCKAYEPKGLIPLTGYGDWPICHCEHLAQDHNEE